MPGMRCAVAVCNNNWQKAKKEGLEISFHRFPKDIKRHKIWVNACRRNDEFNSTTSYICSVHFSEGDYEIDLQSVLVPNVLPKRKLKESAIPRHLLRKDEGNSSNSLNLSRDTRIHKRHQKQIVAELLVPCESELLMPSTPQEKSLESRFEEIKSENQELKEKIVNMQKEIDSQQNEIEKLKTVIEESNKNNIPIATLTGIFSQTQIELIKETKRKVRWSTDDISKAFSIRYLSKRCYVFIRDKLKYPLPHVSTLQKWASKLNFQQGLLKDVLRIMNVAGSTMSEFEKLCVIQFDEMKVSSVFEYDRVHDQILGPHSYMQQIMVRGLFSKWKQPVFIDFDQKVTPDILNKIIFQLHQISYKVVACVSDCGGGNMGLWKSLGITIDMTHFIHPEIKTKIYVFADAPHLLKLIRNWLIDTGFILGSGGLVSKAPLQALVDLVNKEVTTCHQLTQKHLDCHKNERQNVLLATQLLSHSVATALCHYKPGNNEDLAESTGSFIELTNSWFDIMNSYTPKVSLHSKKPYGLMLDEQNDILKKMYETVSSMRCVGKKNLQVFQKGIMVSIKSLQALFADLKENHAASYILTSRLNQDGLENSFSQVRQVGGLHDHPTPLEAVQRLKIIVLGKNPGLIQRNTNIRSNEQTSEEEYLVSKVLRIADVSADVKDPNISNDDNMYSFNELSEKSSSSEDSSILLKEENEEDGFKYLCGWIARKFRYKYNFLGSYTKDVSKPDHSYTKPQEWIQHLSFGGLSEPSEIWLKNAKMFERIFLHFHKNDLNRVGNVVQKVITRIKKKVPDFPEEIIKAFVLQRTYIRIKYLNCQVQKKSDMKRGASEDKRRAKKLKKTVT